MNWGSGCGFYFFIFCYFFFILEGEGGHEFFFLHLKKGGRRGFNFWLLLLLFIFFCHIFYLLKRGRVAWVLLFCVATPLSKECEDDTHTPEMWTWELSGIPKTSEFVCRGHNTLHEGVFYIIQKLSKFKC